MCHNLTTRNHGIVGYHEVLILSAKSNTGKVHLDISLMDKNSKGVLFISFKNLTHNNAHENLKDFIMIPKKKIFYIKYAGFIQDFICFKDINKKSYNVNRFQFKFTCHTRSYQKN